MTALDTAAVEATAPPATGLSATLKHARHVVTGNPITGFSFTLFVLLLVCALFGPYLVPYDPLATNTAVALKPPSLHHLMGTDQLGRDLLSRVVVATRLDMAVAIWKVHAAHGFFLPAGFEFSMVLTGALVSLMLTGPGAISIDGWRARSAEARAYGRARIRSGNV